MAFIRIFLVSAPDISFRSANTIRLISTFYYIFLLSVVLQNTDKQYIIELHRSM